jgi:O-acetylserine/cysteine efflux transporter
LPLVALSLVVDGPAAVWDAVAPPAWPAVLSVLFMAYPATVMAFSIWNILLSRHPAATVAPFALLIPVVGLVSSAIAFGERLGAVEIAASGLILSGLVVGLRGTPKTVPSAADRGGSTGVGDRR